MINLARQAFANPFLSGVGTSFQPGAVNTVGRCPCCGSTVAVASPIQPQIGGLQTLGVGGTLGQQMGGFSSVPYAGSQPTGFPQVNPLASQLMGSSQTINPLAAQLGTNWPVSAIPHQGIGSRLGAYGVDPRLAFGGVGQQFGYNDPNVLPGLNQGIAGDPISSLFQQQVNPLAQQQLPIRSLIGGQQGLGAQSLIPGIGSQVGQWADPYRSFLEAQWISQLTNPLHQLHRAYGAPETGFGTPFGVGQQFNPFFANVPFYG
ncbi:MAG TPA: hypothetical protein VKN18_00605 [Blastocatellia bacterium]|nr:hypothetical protein [Blastocatellia bacterium]